MSAIVLATLAAVASGLSLPNYEKVIQSADYPAWALIKTETTAAVIEFYIDLEGRVYGCKLLGNVGSRKLAGELCRITTRRKVGPARLANGTATHGYVKDLVRMWTEGGSSDVAKAKLASDIEFTVKAESLGKERLEGGLILAVGTDGAVLDCTPSPAVEAQNVPTFRQICTQRKLLAQPPRLDENGKPMTYVTEYRIALIPEG